MVFHADAGKEYSSFLDALQRSAASKLLCEVSTEEQLYTHSALGLLLADATIMTGVGREGMMILPGPNAPSIQIQVPIHLANKPVTIGTFGFTENVVDRWADEARDLISAGRLIYLPKRVLVWQENDVDGTHEFKAEAAELGSPWHVWHLAALSQRASLTPMVAVGPSASEVQVLSFAMPWISGVRLSVLEDALDEATDSLATFRKELASALKSELRPDEQQSEDELRQVGARLRRDIIDPEIANLNNEFRKVVQSHALRIGGAAVSTVGLVLTAMSGVGIGSLLSGSAGSGTAGLLLKEVADLRSDLIDLQKRPWYLLWRIQRAA